MQSYRDFFLSPVPQPDYSLTAFQKHFALSEKDSKQAYKSSLQWVMSNQGDNLPTDRHILLRSALRKYVYKKHHKETMRTTVRGNNNLIAADNRAFGGSPSPAMRTDIRGNNNVVAGDNRTSAAPAVHTSSPTHDLRFSGVTPPPQNQPRICDCHNKNSDEDIIAGDSDAESNATDWASLPSTRILPRTPSPMPFQLAIAAPYHQSLINISNTSKHLLRSGRYLEDHIGEISRFLRENTDRHALLNLGIVDLDDHIWLQYGGEFVNNLKWGLPKWEIVREFYFVEQEFDSYWKTLDQGVPSERSMAAPGDRAAMTVHINPMNVGKLSQWYRSAVVHLQLLDMLSIRTLGDPSGLCGSPEHTMLLLDSVFAISGNFQRKRICDIPLLRDFLPSSTPPPPNAFAYVHVDRQIPFAFVLPTYPPTASNTFNASIFATSSNDPSVPQNQNPQQNNGLQSHIPLVLSMHAVLRHFQMALQQSPGGSGEDLSVCAYLCYGNRIEVLVLRAHGAYSQVLKRNRLSLGGSAGKDGLVTLWQLAGHMQGMANRYCALFSEMGR